MEYELYRNVFILRDPLLLFSLWCDMMVFVILALSCLLEISVQRSMFQTRKGGTNGPIFYPTMFEILSEESFL
jgi:hypothetical protein